MRRLHRIGDRRRVAEPDDARSAGRRNDRTRGGGQRGSYPARQCVERATAAQAAAYFVSTGGADPRLCWQPD
ncbi:hypothetical protein FCJ61_15805 [Burkholderia metallica]|nr:hypothetical protein [Burkholderia metallica]